MCVSQRSSLFSSLSGRLFCKLVIKLINSLEKSKRKFCETDYTLSNPEKKVGLFRKGVTHGLAHQSHSRPQRMRVTPFEKTTSLIERLRS